MPLGAVVWVVAGSAKIWQVDPPVCTVCPPPLGRLKLGRLSQEWRRHLYQPPSNFENTTSALKIQVWLRLQAGNVYCWNNMSQLPSADYTRNLTQYWCNSKFIQMQIYLSHSFDKLHKVQTWETFVTWFYGYELYMRLRHYCLSLRSHRLFLLLFRIDDVKLIGFLVGSRHLGQRQVESGGGGGGRRRQLWLRHHRRWEGGGRHDHWFCWWSCSNGADVGLCVRCQRHVVLHS